MKAIKDMRLRGLAALALLGCGLAAGRADAGVVGYAYSEQTISGVSITPVTPGTTLTVTNALSTGTADSASLFGSGPAKNDPTDTPLSYVGPAPGPPENDFSKFATFTGPIVTGSLPTGTTNATPLDNFTRGDVQLANLNNPNVMASASAVAESYLNTATNSQGAGSANYSANISFTSNTATALTISYNYLNDLFASVSGNGSSAQATYKFDITLANAAGVTIFNNASPASNLSISAPPNGVELASNGTVSFLTPILLANQVYSLTFSGSVGSFVGTSSAVPEPATIGMAGIAVVAGLGAMLRRRRAV